MKKVFFVAFKRFVQFVSKIVKETLSIPESDIRAAFVWLPPVVLLCWLFYVAAVPDKNTTQYAKTLTRKEAQFQMFLAQNLSLTESPFPKFTNVPDEGILEMLKIPKQFGEHDYCIYFKGADYNIDEQLITSNDKLVVALSGSTTKISSDDEQCFKVLPEKLEFEIDTKQSNERIKNWGVRDKNNTYDTLYGQYQISYRNRLQVSLLLTFPFLMIAAWWGFLLIYSKIETDFLKRR
ncbi:MAG TPA: hypothetical protein PKV72_05120 [Candidatus Peribacteria bacterium]|nr:hypothetical protein [Candidatus Peribacteria bacterium]